MEEIQGCKMCTEAKGRREEGRDRIRRRREGEKEGGTKREGRWVEERDGGRERERERKRERRVWETVGD